MPALRSDGANRAADARQTRGLADVAHRHGGERQSENASFRLACDAEADGAESGLTRTAGLECLSVILSLRSEIRVDLFFRCGGKAPSFAIMLPDG